MVHGVLEGRRRGVAGLALDELDGGHGADCAHVADLFDFLLERAHVLVEQVLQQAGVFQHATSLDQLDAGQGAGAGGRGKAVGAAQVQIGLGHHLVGAEDRRNRLAAGGEGLAQQDQVGVDVVPALHGEHLAAAAHAGLHLVQAQQPAPALAQRAEAVPEGLRRCMDAAFAEHRLDQHASHLAGMHLLHQQVLQVVEHLAVVERTRALAEGGTEAIGVGHHDHPGDELGTPRGNVGQVAGGAGGHIGGLAVVLAAEGDDQRTFAGLAHEFNRAFHRQGAGHRIFDPVDSSGGDLRQLLHQRQGGVIVQPAADLHAVTVPGLCHGLAHRRWGRAVGRGAPGGQVIGETVVVGIDNQVAAAAALHQRVDAVVGVAAGHMRGVAGKQLAALRPRQGGDDFWQFDVLRHGGLLDLGFAPVCQCFDAADFRADPRENRGVCARRRLRASWGLPAGTPYRARYGSA